MNTESTNSVACIYDELEQEVTNVNYNDNTGLNATKRAVFAEKNLI